ncbi:hypothetical protein [Sphingorhabdus sp. Alg231-15]|uniref:hypothetical protein n=1 Tax=Sphingorhabdus sp. Alg231-15 TaxID=1922222 RepID=UPI000D54BCC5
MALQPGRWAGLNVPAGLAALITQSASIFFVLWSISDRLGLEELGLYSLLIGSLTILSLTEFGIGTSMVFFSQRPDSPQRKGFSHYYSTALWTAIAVTLTFVVLTYWPANLFLESQMPNADLVAKLHQCLPIVFLTAAVIGVGKVPINALNGLDHFAPVQFLRTGSYMLLPPLAYFGIVELGLYGVIVARLLVEIILTVSAHAMVWSTLPGLHFLPRWFGRNQLKEMLGISLSFQTSSIILILFEPLAKVALTMSGSLVIVGQYEVAARITGFTKELFIRPMAFLGGVFSRNSENRDIAKPTILLSNLLLVSIPMAALSFAFVIAFLPLSGEILLNGPVDFYVLVSLSLGIGWAISICAVGPYFYCIGVGNNRPNLESAMIISFGSAAFSCAAIILDSIWLVPIGTGLSLVIGEIYLVIRVRYLIRLSLLPMDLVKEFLLATLVVSLGAVIYVLDNRVLLAADLPARLAIVGMLIAVLAATTIAMKRDTLKLILRHR